MHVSVTALGLGLEYNETLLSSLAQTTGGKFHFIEDSTQVATVFREEVLRLERVVARDMQLTLLPGPGVTIEGVLGHTATANGHPRAVSLQLGDLGEGAHRDLIVRLRVGPHRDGAALELMDTVLNFQDAVVGAARSSGGSTSRRAPARTWRSSPRAATPSSSGRSPAHWPTLPPSMPSRSQGE